MLLQIPSSLSSLSLYNFNKIHPPSTSRTLSSIRATTSTTSPPSISLHLTPNSPPSLPLLSTTTSPISPVRNVAFRPTPELGLLSNLFVFFMVFGAFFSVALISIPTLIAFGRLGNSVKKLSKVVSEEVPGTLSSLKLSSLEINDLTQQLSSLRHKISGVGIGRKNENTTRSRFVRKKNSAS